MATNTADNLVIYTEKSVDWNGERLHVAFCRPGNTGLLELTVVLADQSEGYEPGTHFEYVTKYDGVPVKELRAVTGTQTVLVKDYTENAGILRVLIDAGILGQPVRSLTLSEGRVVHVCQVLVSYE
jgi:hypothetical protein